MGPSCDLCVGGVALKRHFVHVKIDLRGKQLYNILWGDKQTALTGKPG